MTRLHLYGVVRAGTAVPPIRGVGDPPGTPRPIVADDLAAVASDLPEDYQLSDQDAVEHLQVLNALVLSGPVLPLMYGTEAPDEEAVREEVLGLQAEDLRLLLDALDGLVELRVSIQFEEQDALRRMLEDNPQLKDLAARSRGAGMDVQVELGEQVAEALAGWCRQRGAELLEPLADLAQRTHPLDGREPTVDRWALLVPTTELSTMDKKVEELRRRAGGAEVEYVGPLPAFSFLDSVLDEAAAARPRW